MATNLELVARVRVVLEQTREKINKLLALEAELIEHDVQEIARDDRPSRLTDLRSKMRDTDVDDSGWNGGRN